VIHNFVVFIILLRHEKGCSMQHGIELIYTSFCFGKHSVIAEQPLSTDYLNEFIIPVS